MVVFKNGKKAKNEYRKYKISQDKNDDYLARKEVIYRRYYKALVEKKELPDLILVDGGVGQINACLEVLNALNLSIKVCGLQKDDHHRTSSLVDGDTLQIIDIPKTSDIFHYLTRIQDEVHRYTITYHQTLRGKGSLSSLLENIEGIGPKRKKELLKKYGSLKKIKEASVDELKEIIPEKSAKELLDYLKERDNHASN